MIAPQLQSIQVLRGVAAMVVFFHHLSGNFSKTLGLTLPYDFFNFGFCGVDLFFVISGFIIHKTSSNYQYGLNPFWLYIKKRFKRVYPIYWIVICPVILLSIILLGKKDIGTIYSLFSILLLFPGHDAVNPVSWTLSYELYFYLIFSLVILDRRLLIFPILILIISFINLFTHTFGSSLLDKHPLYFYFSPFNFEFLAGVLVSLFGQKFTLNKTVIYASFLGIIVYMFLFGTTILDDVNQQRVGVFLIPSLLLVFCITNLETNFNFKFSETLIKLGNASYALYLIHFPIIILVTKITKHLSINNLSVWILFLVLFITIPFSAFLLHEKIEKKVIKALK